MRGVLAFFDDGRYLISIKRQLILYLEIVLISIMIQYFITKIIINFLVLIGITVPLLILSVDLIHTWSITRKLVSRSKDIGSFDRQMRCRYAPFKNVFFFETVDDGNQNVVICDEVGDSDNRATAGSDSEQRN